MLCACLAMDDKSKPSFYCQICSTRFKRKDNLATHIRRSDHYIHKKVPQLLKDVLPKGYVFFVCSFKQHKNSYSTKLCLLDVRTKEQVHEWVTKFMKINDCIYVRRRTGSSPGLLYATTYSCQLYRDSSRSKRTTKGTNCKSSIYVSIKNGVWISTYVAIQFNHNHLLHSENDLWYRTPTKEVVRIFEKFYENGLQPIEALRSYKNHLQLQFSQEDFELMKTDRSFLPDYDWVRYTHNKMFKRRYTSLKPMNVLNAVKKVIAKKDNQICAFEESDSNQFVVSMLTPLMKRILQTTIAGETMIFEYVGSIESYGWRVCLLLTKTSVGQMPVGAIINTDDSVIATKRGLRLYMSLTDNTCFGDRGSRGPVVVMTNNLVNESETVAAVFPTARQYISHTRVLQLTYRWLQSQEFLSQNDKVTLYNEIKSMVCSKSKEEMESAYHRIAKNYADCKVQSFIKRFHGKKAKWLLYYPPDDQQEDTNSNHLVDCAMRVFKDELLNRSKTRSPVQLANFLLNDFDRYFSAKLLDACVGRNNARKRMELFANQRIYSTTPLTENPSIFYVKDENKNLIYAINVDIGICSCHRGVIGGYCKHQQFLATTIEVHQPRSMISSEDKEYLYYIATGDSSFKMPFDPYYPTTLNDVEGCMSDDVFDVIAEEVICSDEDSNVDENVETEEIELTEIHQQFECEKDLEERNEQFKNFAVKHEECCVVFEENVSEDTSNNDVTSQSLETVNVENVISNLKENLNNLLRALNEDPCYYFPVICYLNKEMVEINKSTPEALLQTLTNFNKNISLVSS